MKKNLVRILLLSLALLMVFALASCDILSQYIPFLNGDGSSNDDLPEEEEGKLLLIHNGKALFNVVYTAKSGTSGKKTADIFVKDLRNLGVEINDPVSDKNAADVTERELIIGANAQNRGDDCCITTQYLGEDGQAIKIVGKRIIIAGGTADLTVKLFNIYVANEMKITSKVTSLTALSVKDDYNYEKLTKYSINSIKIGDVDLGDFTVVFDLDALIDKNYSVAKISKFAEDVFAESGIVVNVGKLANVESYDHAIIVRYVDTYVGNARNKDHELERNGGFRAYIDGNDYIVECCYMSTFERAYTDFLKKVFIGGSGDVVVNKEYTDEANTVYYEEFGAKGDGSTDDYKALYDTHIFANKCGQRVCGTAGKRYTIGAASLVKTIPVKTDVDFNGATITVDDYGSAAYKNRGVELFTTTREAGGVVTLTGDEVYALYEEYRKNVNPEAPETLIIDSKTESFPWLAPKLEVNSMVRIISSTHKDFIRHGSNENSGSNRMDVFMVEANGDFVREVVDKEDLDGNGVLGNVTTPVAYSFGTKDPEDPSVTYAGLNAVDENGKPTFNNNITQLIIYRNDDAPITIKNGNFFNICCRGVSDTNFMVKYHEYTRGFYLNRPNVTIENLTHRMKNEPEFHEIINPATHTCDGYCKDHGSRQESYPYYGFFLIEYTSNLLIKNCNLTGHTTYYEDKPATGSTGGSKPAPVPAGSYDFVVERSCNVTFDTVIQGFSTLNDRGEVVDTGLGDERYWGIMSSNGSKNMTFKNCQINRFDAHQGFWNATLIDTVIGHSFNVVGGGTLNAIRVTKITNNCDFIFLRGDYGGTFRGDMNIIDCKYLNYKSYQTTRGTYLDETPLENALMINSGFETTNKYFRTPEELEKAYQDEYKKVYDREKEKLKPKVESGELTEQAAHDSADKTAKAAAKNMSKQGGYWLWDFGYDCYLPTKINIRNFQCEATSIKILKAFPDAVFAQNYDFKNPKVTSESIFNTLNITKEINISEPKMPDNMAVCTTNSTTGEMERIPVNENYDWEAKYNWFWKNIAKPSESEN